MGGGQRSHLFILAEETSYPNDSLEVKWEYFSLSTGTLGWTCGKQDLAPDICINIKATKKQSFGSDLKRYTEEVIHCVFCPKVC